MKEEINDLKSTCEKLTEAIRKFPEQRRDEILFGEWCLKDSIAHLSGWNLQRIKEIKKFLDGDPIEKIYDFDTFNEIEVTKRKGISWEDLYKEFIESCSKLIEAFEIIPEEFYDEPIWEGSSITPRKWLLIDTRHMKDEHLTQLKDFI